jgi:hypothetical protein
MRIGPLSLSLFEVLAVLPHFDLRAFQEPTDSTIRSLSRLTRSTAIQP